VTVDRLDRNRYTSRPTQIHIVHTHDNKSELTEAKPTESASIRNFLKTDATRRYTDIHTYIRTKICVVSHRYTEMAPKCHTKVQLLTTFLSLPLTPL